MKTDKKPKPSLNIQSILTNRRYLVFSILIGLIGLTAIFSGIVPQLNNLLDVRSEIKVSEKKVISLRQKVADLSSLEAQEAFTYVESVDQILPSKKPLLELMSALSLVAGRNNVSFTDLSLSPGRIASESAEFLDEARSLNNGSRVVKSKNDQGFETIVVELEISGIFKNVQGFFSDIEKVAPLTTITSLSLDIKSDDIISPTDEVQAELVLSTYYFTQSVSAGVDSLLPNISTHEQEIINEINGYMYPAINTQEQIEGGGLEDLFGLNLDDQLLEL